MESILHYIVISLSDALVGGLVLFGGTTLLSVLLYHASARMREVGSSCLGNKYYKLVAIGVACHETGHALGCLLMYPAGVRIAEYVPFSPQPDGTLGWVKWGIIGQKPKRWVVSIAQVITGTGPIWFGTIVVYLLTSIFYSTPEVNITAEDSVIGNLAGIVAGAYTFLVHIWLGVANRPLLSLIYIYLVFCVVSEMKLSSADMEGMGQGVLCLCVLFVMLNMIPIVDVIVDKAIDVLAAYMIFVNAIMLSVLVLHLLFTALLAMLDTKES